MKKLIGYLPTYILLCVILGIYSQFYWQIWDYGYGKLIFCICIAFLILLLTHFYKKKVLFILITFFIFIIIGIASVYISNSGNYINHYSKLKSQNSLVVLRIEEQLKTTNYSQRYIAKIMQVETQGRKGRVLLSIRKDSMRKKLAIHNILLLKANFLEIRPSLNPYQFNYREYLLKQGINHQIFTQNNQFKLLENNSFSIIKFIAFLRNDIQYTLKNCFSQNEFSIINALLLGQRQEISKDLLENYTNAGAIHILAISGLHIGILLILLSYIFKPLERFTYGKILKTVLVIFFLWGFAFFTGLSASVTRAVTMFTFISIGQSFNRKQPVEYSLITSMLLLLLFNPLFLFDVGFQLSYIAVFGIVWIQPLILQIWNPKSWGRGGLYKFWQLTTVSLAAQISTLPISLYYFHQFPGLFILTNWVIVPSLGFILGIGILVIILAIFHSLPDFLVYGYGQIIKLMNVFVDWVSAQEQFLFSQVSMPFINMILWYFIIILVVQYLTKTNFKIMVSLLLSIGITQFVYIFQKYDRVSKKEIIVFHQNRSSIIGFKNGKEITIRSNLDSTVIQNNQAITSYTIGKNLNMVMEKNTVKMIKINTDYLMFIDSLDVYPKKIINPIVILQYSPKVNLQRLIRTVKPKQIIVDGTNYKSYVEKWKLTSKKEKTPFHNTGKHGAYILKY